LKGIEGVERVERIEKVFVCWPLPLLSPSPRREGEANHYQCISPSLLGEGLGRGKLIKDL
jgi:hypothetical protein